MSGLESVEFAVNPEPRCACVLLLDTSGSMDGPRMDQLNAGLQAFKQALSEDSLAMMRVEVAIITFGPVEVIQDFVTANQFTPPQLTASGETPMGSAINEALDRLADRRETYKQNQIPFFRPMIFLITDGEATDDTDDWKRASDRIHTQEGLKKISFFAVGVEGANMAKLAELGNRKPLQLRDVGKFEEMFQWLSASLTSASQATPGEDVVLQTPLGWGTI